MGVKMKKSDVLTDMYGLPDYKLRELAVKQSLVDAASLLLSHTDCSILILSFDSNGQPLILEDNGSGRLINFLDFEYDD